MFDIEKIREYKKNYYLSNRRKYLDRYLRYYYKNRERIRERDKVKRRKFEFYPINLYQNIITRLKFLDRNPTYKNRELKFSREEFLNWILKNEKYKELHSNWVKSNFSKKLAPSVDRINNFKGYTLNNIQILTLSDNSKKANKERHFCLHCKHCKDLMK